MTEEQINEFIKWLENEKGLAICNWSKRIMAFWQINSTDGLAKQFIEYRAKSE